MSGEVFVLIGEIIVVGVALQTLALVYISWRRVTQENRRSQVAFQFLESEIAARRSHNKVEADRSALSWNGTRKFEIRQKTVEGGDICSFYLAPHDGKPLPPFLPGQYLTFHLKVPGQEKPVIRCYSLSDSPSNPERYRVSIKRAPPPRDNPDAPPGLSSNFFHDQLAEGDIVDAKAPSGHFFLDLNRYTPVVLMCGGVGITPLLSMLLAICEGDFKRETWFFYGVRNKQEHIMGEMLRDIARAHENVHLHVCYSDPEPGDRQGVDYQHAERISLDLLKRLLPSNNYEFYYCGPPPMMESLTQGLKEWGVPDAQINYEAFVAASVQKAKPKPAAGADAATAYQIEFAHSGTTLDWSPDAESILEFAENNGIAMDSGCRAGNCGTCLTAITAGGVSYLSEPGQAPEDGSCLACIAVPNSNLTLDA